MKPRAASALLALLGVALPLVGLAQAQDEKAAVTMTRDSASRPRLLVNKPLGDARWAISVNLAEKLQDNVTPRVVSVTGNVFTTDSDAVSFVYCQVRRDSLGTLDDPDSTFRLMCKGTDACVGSALDCARSGWRTISRDVAVPASFFLPPGGLRPSGVVQRASWVGDTLARAVAWIRARVPDAGSRDAYAQEERYGGATLSPDRLNHLVLRVFGEQKWAISFNLEPSASDSRGIREVDVTGNVYNSSGPADFLYCVQNTGIPTSLADPSGTLTVRCSVAGPCLASAEECAKSDWQSLEPTTLVPASFFLPEGDAGLVATTYSEQPLLVLGGASSTTSIGANQIQGDDGTCSEGAVCTVDRIGSCEDIRGRKTNVAGACRCLVAPVPPYCIRTGTEEPRDGGFKGARIKAACGAPCAFEVGVPADDGGSIKAPFARGMSLPHPIDPTNCFCRATPAGKSRAIETCNTSAKPGCDNGSDCCVDDPRDGCSPLDGDLDCPGICIASHEGGDACAGRTLADQECGDGEVEGSEVCDPADSTPPSCEGLGFAGGELSCPQCRPEGCDTGNEPPEITDLDETPAEGIGKYGRHAWTGSYEDEDGDVKEVRLRGGGTLYFNVDGAGRPSGEFVVTVGCNGANAAFSYDVQLIDERGNESDSRKIASSCIEPVECGDGVKKDGESCDFASKDPADACPTGEVCRNDCTCGPAGSCAEHCCSAEDAFCGRPAGECQCDPGCDENGRNDCCEDQARECGF